MANILQDSIAGMEDDLIEVASNPVTYTHGETVVSCNALFGETKFENQSNYGFITKGRLFDFLILVADLGFEPEEDDEILYNGTRYQVCSFGDENHFRFTTSHRYMYRIHTKEYK